MNKLFILCGASGSGKSTLLDRVTNEHLCIPAIKYSERKKFNTVDDVTSVSSIFDKNLKCDLIYKMYGNYYGFSSENIKKCLCKGNVILITNDTSVIEKLKYFFKKQIVIIFIVSDINKRLLRQIYMKRHCFPSIKEYEAEFLDKLIYAKSMLCQNNSEEFINSLESINKLIDNIALKDNEFRLRLESIKNQEEIYSSEIFNYDYVVLNLYSNTTSPIHATEKAYELLVKIIKKETGVQK